jgi:hypothetical protein
MFYIGQKVVCIKGKFSACGVDLKENGIYTVKNIWSCRCNMVLDVGLRITSNDICFNCDTLLSTDGVWWLYAKRFVPLEEWQDADKNIKQLLKEIQEPVQARK